LAAPVAPPRSRTVEIRPELTRIDTPRGTYFAAGGEVRFQPGRPATPRVSVDVTDPTLGLAHGAFLESATYAELAGLRPFVANVATDAAIRRTSYVGQGWSPGRLGALARLAGRDGGSDTLTVLAAQHVGEAARIYAELRYTVYYSPTQQGRVPVAEAVDAAADGAVVVRATGGGALARVGATWTSGDGSWATADLAYDAATGTWRGTLPAAAPATFFVQLADGHGNVGQADNAGLYYRAGAP